MATLEQPDTFTVTLSLRELCLIRRGLTSLKTYGDVVDYDDAIDLLTDLSGEN